MKKISRHQTIDSIQVISYRGMLGLICMLVLCFAMPLPSTADPHDTDNILILYYSRTGKSRIVADTLQEHFKADVLEIHESKDRSGILGFYGAAVDCFLDREADLVPSEIDLSGYDTVIMIAPIWNWNIAIPARTCLTRADLNGKKLLLFTTANIDIKKYEIYDDDAPFVKRFLRDYLRSKSAMMRERTKKTGADMRGHFHVETQDISDQQIREATLQHLKQIEAALALTEHKPA